MSESVYFGEWAESGFIGMVADFSDICLTRAEYEAPVCPWKNLGYWEESKERMDKALAADEFHGVEVLFAAYTNEGYSGDAFVLFRRGGSLFEVNGGHCSCYQLEGQWEPEATSVEAIRRRLDVPHPYGAVGEFKSALELALEKLEQGT